jgi:hypothetical protein
MQYVELEAGLVGLVVGAVASGGVQSYLSRADRRRDARSGARLLYMQLHAARSAVEDLRQRRDWGQMITDWDAYGASWDRHSEKLAAVINTTRFHLVSSAFGCIASLARSKERETSQPPSTLGAPTFGPPDDLLAVYEANIEAAKRIVLRASFRWWEIRVRKKALAE